MLASTATMASISAGSVSRLRGVFIFRLRCYPDALPAIKSSPAFILFVALLMRFLLTDVLPASGRELVLTRPPTIVPLGACPHDKRVYTAICEVPPASRTMDKRTSDCLLLSR